MRGSGAADCGAMRVHAVILTRDRTDVLARCIETALSTLGPSGALTILDDSSSPAVLVNAAILTEAARHSSAGITHIRAEELHDAIAGATNGRRALWQSKTAPRDIAPLRNLSLLISAAVDAHTTVLVDDDICGFDLMGTHEMLDAFGCGPEGVVAGAAIGGTTEQDTVTRLSDALCVLETKAHNTATPIEELFRVPPDSDGRGGDGFGVPSAGYMAFRLPSARLFAFPPGYNEDWLWCLLHEADGETRVVRTNQAVAHEPPLLRRSTRGDILFELAGDLVLDCLAERRTGNRRGPEATLDELARREPDPSVMPLVRANELLEEACRLADNGHKRTLLELACYGLRTLEDMRRSGELEMDGGPMLRAWSSDAVAKHQSFAATLRTASAGFAVTASLRKGRL